MITFCGYIMLSSTCTDNSLIQIKRESHLIRQGEVSQCKKELIFKYFYLMTISLTLKMVIRDLLMIDQWTLFELLLDLMNAINLFKRAFNYTYKECNKQI